VETTVSVMTIWLLGLVVRVGSVVLLR
jgi:hypothetical protein